MIITRRNMLTGAAAALALPARAQTGWPDRPITLVHGLAPGGPADITARIVAEALSRRLGQQVVVDARPGAGGRVAAAQVAKLPPDGYTLMNIPSGHAVSAAMYKTLPYRTVEDFAPISQLTDYPFVVVVNADTPIRSLSDLLAKGRTQSTPLLFGSAGNGSLQHLAGELLARVVKLTFQHVPYRGSAQAITDLLARRIDLIVDSPTAEMQHIRAGTVRALAVTSRERFFALPDTPTAAESGIPEFTFGSWQGIVGPAGLPEEIVARLNAELAAVLAEPAVVERLRQGGNNPTHSTPQAFRDRMLADIAKWTAVVDAAKIERV